MLAYVARGKRTPARGKRPVAPCSLTSFEGSEHPLEVNDPSLEGSEHPLAATNIRLRFTSIRSRFTSVRSRFTSVRSSGVLSTQCSLPSARCSLPSARRWRRAAKSGLFSRRSIRRKRGWRADSSRTTHTPGSCVNPTFNKMLRWKSKTDFRHTYGMRGERAAPTGSRRAGSGSCCSICPLLDKGHVMSIQVQSPTAKRAYVRGQWRLS